MRLNVSGQVGDHVRTYVANADIVVNDLNQRTKKLEIVPILPNGPFYPSMIRNGDVLRHPVGLSMIRLMKNEVNLT